MLAAFLLHGIQPGPAGLHLEYVADLHGVRRGFRRRHRHVRSRLLCDQAWPRLPSAPLLSACASRRAYRRSAFPRSPVAQIEPTQSCCTTMRQAAASRTLHTLQLYLDVLAPDGFTIEIKAKRGNKLSQLCSKYLLRFDRALYDQKTRRELMRDLGRKGGKISTSKTYKNRARRSSAPRRHRIRPRAPSTSSRTSETRLKQLEVKQHR